MSKVKQPKNLSTNSLRYPTILQDAGTKKAVTQPRLEQHKCEMKKRVRKEYPRPNSIFGMGGDLASFNAEVFGYCSLWRVWDKTRAWPAPSARSRNSSGASSLGHSSFFPLEFCPRQSNLRQDYLLT